MSAPKPLRIAVTADLHYGTRHTSGNQATHDLAARLIEEPPDLLILAGDNDSRCPIRQILNYCDRLTELGREFELYRFEAGHGSMVIEEQIRQMRMRLEFTLARIDVDSTVTSGRA